ncbi:MAG: hypothetical protein M3680_16150 [Myxococcota bacterium]|nr:hypothetical protein [Myxococcota bacterium]
MRMQTMMHAQAYVLVGALIDLAPYEDVRAFMQDTQVTIRDHRDDAQDLLRDLQPRP